MTKAIAIVAISISSIVLVLIYFRLLTVISPTNIDAEASSSKPIVLQWGAYVGDGTDNLNIFETLVGQKTDIYAHFEGWHEDFPSNLASRIGGSGKTLLIFWEPSFGYDEINNGSKDDYIAKFSKDAKAYGYPIILVPFPEMNLNEEAWGYSQNGNTAQSFKKAWIRVHGNFTGASNVKFGIAYNNVSIPDIMGNQFDDYYPGAAYVDYVGVDGFNFSEPWLSFGQIFDIPMAKLATYRKPIYIFSTASIAGQGKSAWIAEGLGYRVKTYKNLVGWVWFNQGGDPNWVVNSDINSLQAFKSVIPKK